MSGDEFRKLRTSMDLKQNELGALLDVSDRGIRRWEKNEVDIPKIAELALLYLANQKRRKGKR
jgi:DNA-binding transcriptional regulator YiaG